VVVARDPPIWRVAGVSASIRLSVQKGVICSSPRVV
jgi:hypothetical protein